MSKDKNTMVGNYLWIDGVYGRDGNSTQNNSDSNIFSGNSNKNGDNPTTWALGAGSIPQKDDIVDVFGYLRRDLSPAALAINPNGILWGFGGASKISSDGNSHFDFEFFRTEVTFNGSALVGSGAQSGHTAWAFDATGKVLVPGDVLVAIDFENGGTKPFASVRVWMSSADIANFNSRPNRPYDLTGVFDQGNGAPPYGYAEINAKGGGILTDVFAVVNVTAATLGPPWGTLEGSQASYQDNFAALQFTEFGLNLTALGLDSRTINQGPCSNLLGTLIVKTRSSSSFTAELKDFSGPYLFGNITDVAVVGNVSNPLTCNNPTATLTATPTPANATIKWYGPSPDGIADGPFIAGNAPVVSVKGVYTVYAFTSLEGCFAKKMVTVLENKVPPNVNAGDDKALTCLITSIKLSGSSSTPNATFLWSTLDGNIVSGGTTLTPTIDKAGTYTLTVTDPVNGCQKADTVLVTSTPPTPINIACPGDNIKSSCFYADQAAVNAAFDTFKQGFTASGGNGTLTITGLENLTPPALCGGTVTVNYNVTDSCGLQKSCSATFTITAPAAVVPVSPNPVSASACAYADQAALDAAFATFKQGFSVSGGCDPKGVFVGNPVAPTLCQGGTTSVSYMITDKCYTNTITKDFTITAPAAVVPVSPNPVSASACAYADQAALDAAFATFKQGFSVSGGCAPQGVIQGSPVAPKLCDGGTTTVTYKVTDKCYETTISRDFMITAPAAVVPVSPDPFSASACAFADQAAINAAFETFKKGFSVSGGCDAKGVFVGNPVAPNLCQGGTTSVSYMITDKCYTNTITKNFTITAPAAVVPVSPDPFSASACAYVDQAAINAAFETFKQGFSVSGGCDPKGVIVGNPVAPNLCQGGTTSVSYMITDKCYTNTITKNFTITKADLLNVSSPPNKTVVCGENPDTAFAAWIAGFKFTGGCPGNVQATDLSQFVKPQVGVSLVIEYVVSNNCETIKKVSTFMITPCTTPICTYTQGAYGNVGGIGCAGGKPYTTKALIAKALSTYPGGTMTIGLVGKSVLVSNNATDIDGLISVLPGGGGSKVLASGNPHISALPASYLKNGRINNTLLAQTITLGLNIGIDSELSKFKLQAGGILAVAEPDGGCGSITPKVRSCNADGTVSNEYKYYTIPSNVVSKLAGDKTVGDLFNLANQALGGGNTYGLSLTDIASLVDLINNAFDECRIAIGYNIPPLACVATQAPIVTQATTAPDTTAVQSSGKESKKPSFDAYPVPFKNYITIRYNFDYESDVKIELFNMSGTLLSSKTDTNSYLGKEYNFNIDFYVGKFQVYILKVTTNKGSSTKKIISAGN
ncbi:T9SS type A sorting domain-containing protein [uncultured Flavobacterium sp.]|uniref:T9SS type A sorting domain-containing protein n=1 Tax=uncultured Flavobacterium sp. TaxID=165435 RepID=UPI00292F20E5|nr:T9SS type A sorting domain-containing protein [uncultured Flavobacterium sp.]